MEGHVNREWTKGSLVVASFPGMVTQDLSPCSLGFWSFLSRLSLPHIIPWSGMAFIYSQPQGVSLLLTTMSRRQSPGRRDPLWEATQPTTTLTSQDVPQLSPKNGAQQHCARYFRLHGFILFSQYLWEGKLRLIHDFNSGRSGWLQSSWSLHCSLLPLKIERQRGHSLQLRVQAV